MKPQHVIAVAHRLHAAADLLEANAGVYLDHHYAWSRGLTANPGEPIPTGGDHSDPTSTAALARTPDPTVHRGWTLPAVLATIDELAMIARVLMDQLTPRDPATIDRATVATCLACARTVACTEADRLRRGLCTACYHAWRRSDTDDAVTWARRQHPDEAA